MDLSSSPYSSKDFLGGLSIEDIRKEAESYGAFPVSGEPKVDSPSVSDDAGVSSSSSPEVNVKSGFAYARFVCPSILWTLAMFCAKSDGVTISSVLTGSLKSYVDSHKHLLNELLSDVLKSDI